MENITPEQFIELYERISKLADQKVDKALEKKKEDPYSSEETNELATAMAKAQGEYPTFVKNKVNSHSKMLYADLDLTLKEIRPILSKYGVYFRQYTVIDPSGSILLHTRITHSSGQWAESRDRILPNKSDLESIHSEITVKKRIQGESILGITTSDSDDDGEYAMIDARKEFLKGTATNHELNNYKEPYETINQHEYSELVKELKGWPDLAEEIMRKYKITSLADLKKEFFPHVIRQLRINIHERKKED